MNTKTIGRVFLYLAFNLIIGVFLLDVVFVFLLHAPAVTARTPAPVRRLAQQVYRHFNRMLIQFNPACAQYDPEVTYTLKPGTCTFSNLEFNTTYHINRLGLRDDDTNLDAPEVIVIGDSHAMGWGVEQDEAFPRVFARQSGLKVLNAAVSSYATVREMRTLDRLDTSHLRVLILQYADNDLPENRTFRDEGNHLPISSEADYQKIVRYYEAQQHYYPGKYVIRLFMKALHLEAPEPDQLKMDVVPPAEEVDLFLNALEHASEKPLDQLEIVVLEVNQLFEHPQTFINALASRTRSDARTEVERHIATFDTTTVLKPDDFFVLDDHMNARGHRAVGEALARFVHVQ